MKATKSAAALLWAAMLAATAMSSRAATYELTEDEAASGLVRKEGTLTGADYVSQGGRSGYVHHYSFKAVASGTATIKNVYPSDKSVMFTIARIGDTGASDGVMSLYLTEGTSYSIDVGSEYSGKAYRFEASLPTPVKSYTVTFSANGGTASESSRPVVSGNQVGTLPTATRDNHEFAGWWTAAVGGTQVTASTTISSAVTYYAHWTALDFQTAHTAQGVVIKGTSISSGHVSIPSTISGQSVVSIADYAFWRKDGLTGVDIPSTVTNIGVKAFRSCSNISSFKLPAGLKKLGQAAFQDCTSLTEIDVPAGIDYLWSSTFEGCVSLWRVSLPEGVTSIGTSAFANCWSLQVVNIPSSVTKIKSFAFFSCESLSDINLPYGLKTIEQKAFKNCVSLESIAIPYSVTTLGKAAFFNTGLVEATVPGSVAKVDDYCFQKCVFLEKMTLSEGVTAIGLSVWANDGALEEVVFPKSLQTLGGYAFFRCYNLETLWNFSSISYLSTLGDKAFKHCTSLRALYMPSSVKSLPREMCNYCESLETVSGTGNVTFIAQNAFSNCPVLRSVAGLDASALATVKRGNAWWK